MHLGSLKTAAAIAEEHGQGLVVVVGGREWELVKLTVVVASTALPLKSTTPPAMTSSVYSVLGSSGQRGCTFTIASCALTIAGTRPSSGVPPAR